MSASQPDLLAQLSAALAARVAAGAPLAAGILGGHRGPRSGVLWRPDVVVASEQVLPRRDAYEVVLPGGATASGRLAGRDSGTNVAVLRLDRPSSGWAEPPRTEAVAPGALVLALASDGSGGAAARLGIVHRAGPAWHSQAGGRIDRLVRLDMALGQREEGGPVLDAAGALLGMSTLGPRGRVLVIPNATVERVLAPLLAEGRVERGWLGVSLQPVALPEEQRGEAGRESGLMVIGLVPGAPAALAGVMQGDILLDLDGEATTHPRALAAALDARRIGQTAALRLLRAGAVQTVSVTVAARPAP